MKTQVKIASLVMFLALIGLLSFQVYWIYSSYIVNKNRIDSSIKQALADTHQKLVTWKLGNSMGLKVTTIEVNVGDNPTSLFDVSTQITFETGVFEALESGFFRFQPKVSQNDFKYMNVILYEHLKSIGFEKDYFLGVWDKTKEDFIYTNKNHINKSSANKNSVNEEADKLIKKTNGFSQKIFSHRNKNEQELFLKFNDNRVIQASLVGIKFIIILSVAMIIMLLGAWYYIIKSLRKQYLLAEMKDDFIDNMTHELKTPIAAASLALEVLSKEETVKKEKGLLTLVDLVSHEQKRILKIVNTILEESSDSQYQLETIDAGKIIKKTVESYIWKVENSDGKLSFDLSEGSFFIKATSNHFENMLINIIDNAIKYSSDSPEIFISTKKLDKHLEIKITDKGIGIDKDKQQLIFEKFYRVNTDNIHDIKGYGLGLSYVKKVVDEMNTKISVDSELNQGTTFTLLIKLESAENE